MKKILILFVAAVFASASHAQVVLEDNFSQLRVHYSTPELSFSSLLLGDEKFIQPTIDGYLLGGEVGSPVLPMHSSLLTIPFCDDIEVSVENAIFDTVPFAEAANWCPMQTARSKSDTGRMVVNINKDVYSTDAFIALPLASVDRIGIARDRQLANLVFSPVSVNPQRGEYVICRQADIIVRYLGSDPQATIDYYQRYHTPAFNVGSTLNNLFSSVKNVTVAAPVRMIIMSSSQLRCSALERFAEWKRSRGMLVDLLYYQDLSLSTNTSIANYLKGLYTNATDTEPAPTYLVLVGDHQQLPAFNSQLTSSWNSVDNTHITDLYFVTWTSGDYIPDCYQGRLSATDTSSLTAIIDKTLLYEQYNFADDSYLARAALVAGEDNGTHRSSGWSADNAWIYADPAMDYIASTYVNSSNGFSTVTYYKNNTNHAPVGGSVTGSCSTNASAAALRTLYNTGIGWINYSAHGDTNEWYKPSFTKNHVSQMTNNGKPSFMIGNCCLTNHFDNPVCFGEALLRKGNNAGAVAYIGGTNYTYWAQDFHWAVGLRSSISNTMDATYQASNLGAYDRLFHTHGESFSDYAITAGSIVFYGNVAVESASSSVTSSSMKKYYWEIYELMGDPSLLPWLGTASDVVFSASLSDGCISVETAPNAYVAIVDTMTNQTLVAGFATADGHLSFCVDTTGFSTANYVVTAQGRRPFAQAFGGKGPEVSIGEVLDASVQVFPNPANDYVTVHVSSGEATATLIDMSGRVLNTRRILSTGSSLDLQPLPSGVYFLRIVSGSDASLRKLIVKH